MSETPSGCSRVCARMAHVDCMQLAGMQLTGVHGMIVLSVQQKEHHISSPGAGGTLLGPDSACQRSLQQQGWSLHAAQAEAQCCRLVWTAAAEHLAEQRREETVAADEGGLGGERSRCKHSTHTDVNFPNVTSAPKSSH